MKKLVWPATIIMAFVAGYFFHGDSGGNIAAGQRPPPAIQGADATAVSGCKAAAIEFAAGKLPQAVVSTQAVKVVADTQVSPATDLATVADHDRPAVSSSSPASASISDEAIDRVLPAPFNEVIKKSNGRDKDIYKKFVEAAEPQDWDMKMQNKLHDAIFSSPYANALAIDSILCKGNICEVRVFEHKNGIWALTMAEMKFQTWWEFSGNSNYGFAVMKDDKLMTGNIALFVRE